LNASPQVRAVVLNWNGGAHVLEAVDACGGADADPAVFVCGPTSFVEAVVSLLGDAGLDPRTVRAERFG